MSSKAGDIRGCYYVVLDAFKASDGRYSPTFKIYHGNPKDGRKAVQRQEFPAPGPDFPTEEEARQRASAMVDHWIAEHGGAQK